MKTLKSTIIYLIATVVEKGLGFLLIPIYTHYLSTQDYGILTLIQAFVAVIIVLFSLSLNGAASRYHFVGKDLYKRFHYGNVFLSVIIIAFVFSIILFFIKNYIFKIIGNIPINPYFYLAISISYLSIIFSIYQLKLQMEHRAIHYSINSIIKFFIMAIFSIIFVVYYKQGAEGVLYGQLISLLFIGIFIVFHLSKEIKYNLNIKLLKRNIKYSIFLVPHNLSGIALQLMDRFFISNMINISQAGIYALGGQISGIIGILSVLINRAATPSILKAFKDKNYEYLKDLSIINIMFISILAMFFSLFSNNIILLIAPTEYAQSAIIINILSLYFIFQMYYFMIVGVLFYVERATKLMPLITFLSLICNLVLNYFLIRLYGMIGAAIATLLSIMIVVYLVIIISNKYIKVGFNHFKIHMIIFVSVIAGNISWIYNTNVMLKIVVFIFITFILLFLERNNNLLFDLKGKIHEKINKYFFKIFLQK